MKHQASVALIIINWNGWQDTITCLESLDSLAYQNYQVIVIDNGSGDDSVEQIHKWMEQKSTLPGKNFVGGGKPKSFAEEFPSASIMLADSRFVFLASKENLGFAGGCNLGIEYALSGSREVDFVLLLNNDSHPESHCITICVDVAQKTDAAIVGAVIKDEHGKKVLFAGFNLPWELFVGRRTHLLDDSREYWFSDIVNGCAMLIRRDSLVQQKKECGYFFDPELFLYYEEADFCGAAKRRGCAIVMAGKAEVYHKLGSSSGGGGTPLSYYYMTRNRLFFAQKYFSFWLRVLFHLWYTPSRFALAMLKTVKKKPRVAVSLMEGLWDGYKGVKGKWKKHSG